MARAKESRKKCQRLIEEIAATENPDVIRREITHIMETCMGLLTPRKQLSAGVVLGKVNGRLELIPMASCPTTEHDAERPEVVVQA